MMRNNFEELENKKEGEQLGFETEQDEIKWAKPPVKGYQYTIITQREGKEVRGDAQLFFVPFSEIENVGMLGSFLKEKGYQRNDLVAHLNEFYPNGRGLDEKTGQSMRKGVGLETLNYLIEESIKRGGKAMYVFTAKESMKAFLRKNDFELFFGEGEKSQLFYKDLREEVQKYEGSVQGKRRGNN